MAAAEQYSQCTLGTCPVEITLFHYRPNLAANTTLLVLCTIAAIIHLVRGIYSRSPWFTFAMVMGCIGETIGYAGRVAAWHRPFSIDAFLIQICCITVAPAFISAALYIGLGDIVRSTSVGVSRLKPRGYAAIFVPCDIVSLVLQGVGGGWSAVQLRAGQDPATAGWITVAGLSFQVLTMLIFIIFACEYAYKVRRSNLNLGGLWAIQGASRRGQIFVFSFALAITCILIRCVYRVIELSNHGWDSPLVRNQTNFIVLEGVMVVLAIYALIGGHPAMLGTDGMPQFAPLGGARSDPDSLEIEK